MMHIVYYAIQSSRYINERPIHLRYLNVNIYSLEKKEKLIKRSCVNLRRIKFNVRQW